MNHIRQSNHNPDASPFNQLHVHVVNGHDQRDIPERSVPPPFDSTVRRVRFPLRHLCEQCKEEDDSGENTQGDENLTFDPSIHGMRVLCVGNWTMTKRLPVRPRMQVPRHQC